MQVIHKHYFGRYACSKYISRSKKLRLLGSVSSTLLGVLVFSILFPIQIKWTNVEATPGTANPSTTSLNLTLSNDTIALNLAPLSSAGTFSSSTPANFTVSTNNVTGYTLSIKSSVSDPTDAIEVANASRLVNTEDSTKYISSISGSVAEDVFSSSTNTQYNNMWGYKPSKLNSSDNTNYLAAPDYNTATILNTTSCANGTSPCTDASDSYSITLGARVDSTLPTGTYEHAFTIIAIGNPINYSITYHANDGADGANTTNMPSPNPQTGNAANDITSINLSTTKPTRSGYELKGWCNVQPIADTNYPDDQDCTSAGGTLYQPGAAYGIDQTTVNIVDLYATWWQPNLAKLNGKKMQDMSPMACYNSSINDTATLTDNRDGTTRSYTVAKLADGLCWMTTNLNLGKSNGSITLTPEDTDITTDFTLPASSSNYSTTNNNTNINTPNNLNNHTIASHTVNGVTYNDSVASYYTYAAATADINTYSKGSVYVTTSICPKNWDLPTESQYLNLRTKGSITSANTAFASPNNFTYGGYRSGASYFTSETSYGYYWTSRNSSSTYAYWTYVYSSGLYSSTTTYYKYYGAMIRCVASQGTTTVNYNGNGTTEYPATGATATQENVEINSAMSRANDFTRTGWWFNGWNTVPDGSGIAIAANAPLSNLNLAPDSTVTLYAQWLPQYTITYTNNCKSWASSDSNCTNNASNNTTTLGINLDASGNGSGTLGSSSTFSLTGWKIKEWTTNADGTGAAYPASSTYNVTGAGAGDGATLYAHWVPIYTVQYDGNGADNPNGMGVANATTGIKPVNHTNVGEGDTFDLFASNFKRDGYGFVGWSTDASAWAHLTDNDNTNDPKIWGPNEVITAPAYSGSPITTLYAVWAPAEKDGSNDPVYLQGWTGCSAMTATTYNSATGTLTVAKNTITALTDQRDSKVYAVAKLADGNCWMIENLRLDTAGTVGQNTIDSSVTNESLSQGYGGVFHGLANPETSNFSNVNTANSLYTTASGVTGKYQLTIDSSYSSYLNYLFPRYNNANTTWNNNTSSATTPTGPSQNVTSAYAHTDYNNYVYSYGNYYTWAAAIASTKHYINYYYANDSRELYHSDAAQTSLCPAGWKLPKGASQNTSGAFYYLNQQMGKNTSAQGSREWRMFPNNFVYSGEYGSSRGRSGDYWSSSAYANRDSKNLAIDSSMVIIDANTYKYYGRSVRCVIENFYSILYDGNGATDGSMYARHTELNSGDTVDLIAPNYEKTGYGFAGWSPSPTATVGGADPIYGPNETITVSSSFINQYADNRHHITLYAVWVAKETNVTMQTFNATNYAAYNSAPIGTVIALEDTRDNDVYAVAKLADGKWWMIENLRLDNDATITTSNTQSNNGAFGGVFTGLPSSVDTNWHSNTSNNLYTGLNAYTLPQLNTNNTNATAMGGTGVNASSISLFDSYNQNNNQVSWYSYGNYYSWAAAMASTIQYTYYNRTGTAGSDSAGTSICPAGWHLPLGVTSTGTLENGLADAANRVGSFSYLDRKLGGNGQNQSSTAGITQSSKWRGFPNNFIYSGYWSGSSASSRGSYGYYWSSSADGSISAYYLNLGSSSVRPGTGSNSKYFGFSVRCISQ